MNNNIRVTAGLMLVGLVFAGCGDAAVVSHWNDRAIVIDGDHSEWEGRLEYLEDAKKHFIQHEGTVPSMNL